MDKIISISLLRGQKKGRAKARPLLSSAELLEAVSQASAPKFSWSHIDSVST